MGTYALLFDLRVGVLIVATIINMNLAHTTTRVEVFSRMGRCPPTVGNNVTVCQSLSSDNCTTDEECSKSLICCYDGCQRQCVQPVLTACEHQKLSSEKRSRALELASSEKPSVHFLTCAPDGRFEPVQCERDTGQCWCVDESGFEIGGTRDKSRDAVNCTSPRPCAGHLCRMLCPYDFQLDEEGCPLCRCRDPCEGIRCPGDTQCQLEEVTCVDGPCPPVPTCKQPRSLDDICPVGKALTVSERNKWFLCGLDPTKPQCPSFFNCVIQPKMEYGVCCPDVDKLVKPGTCPNTTKSDCGQKCQHDMECEGLQKCCNSEQCGPTCSPMAENTPCLQQKILAELLSSREKSGQGYIPQCTKEGLFESRQCSKNGMVCWCVDPSGFKVPRSMGPAENVNCKSKEQNDMEGADPRSCDSILCTQACPFGYKLNADGCQTCDCADLCESIKCPTGMECVIIENDFCTQESCESYPVCKPPPIRYSKPGTCPSADLLVCTNSSCKNDHDCEGTRKCCHTPTCGYTCLEHTKTPQRLPTMCEYLRDFGVNAVDRARARALALPGLDCQPDGSYESVQCHSGYCWCVDEFGAEIMGSRMSDLAKNKIDCSTEKRRKGCDGLLCRLGCDYGFDYDSDGCPICQCRDPCDSTPCPENHQCQLVEVDCYGGFCPAVPQCVPLKSPTATCPLGQALRHPLTNMTRVCDPSSLCPDSHFCHYDGSDSSDGVCCKKLEKPGQCPYRFMPKFGHCENSSLCSSDHQCSGSQKCCSDGCRSTCTEPEMKTACEHHAAAAHFMTQQRSVLLGDMHLPKCDDDDGSFSQVQCGSLGHTCWCVDDAGLEIPDTRSLPGQKPNCTAPISSCAKANMCNLTCSHGYKLDKKGCAMCACHDPCEEILCSQKHEECRLVQVNCITEPCPPVPMCVPRIDNPCPYGDVLPDRRCSALPGGPSCPSTHVCLQSPLGDFSPSCCPKPRATCFQEPTFKECPSISHTTWVFSLSKNGCQKAPPGQCSSSTNSFTNPYECNSTCPPLSECERAREKALYLSKKSGGFGFIPKCRREGSWDAMQCLPEVGLCWCVTASGLYLKGSAVRGTPRCGSTRMGRRLGLEDDAAPARVDSGIQDNGLVCPNGELVHLCNASLCESKVCLNQPNAVCQVDPCGGCRYQFFVDRLQVDCEEGLSSCQRDVQKILNSDSWSLQTMDFLGVILGPQISFDDGDHSDLGDGFDGDDVPLSLVKRQASEETSKTEETKESLDDSNGKSSLPALSLVVMPPRCTVNGEYRSIQRQGELSWCLNQKGEPIHESLTRGVVKCSAAGEVLEKKARGPVCTDPKIKPRVCINECLNAHCPARPDAICLADPCNNCRTTFVANSGEKVECEEKCRQPLEVGMCRAAFPRWHFNATAGKCRPFVYGGCLGNDNNFESEAQCTEECIKPVDVCLLPKRIGICRASMKRWWYNKQTQQCEKFIFGGCDGNANNFETKEHCKATCPDVVLCPRLELAQTMKPCKRSQLCQNHSCDGDSEAVCTVDPCDCSVYYVNYDGQRVDSCALAPTTGTSESVTATESTSTSASKLSTVTKSSVSAVFPSTLVTTTDTAFSEVVTTVLSTLTRCQKLKKLTAMKELHFKQPQCDDLGNFMPIQCKGFIIPDESTEASKCWCVDETGNRIPGSGGFLEGTKTCKTTKVESFSVNLVFVHNNSKEVEQQQNHIKRKLIAALSDKQSTVMAENITIEVSPQAMKMRFVLNGNENMDVAYFIRDTLESGIWPLDLDGVNLRLDAQSSSVEHHLSTLSMLDGNTRPLVTLSATTVTIIVLFSVIAVVLAIVLLIFIMIQRKRSQGYYPRSSMDSLSPIDNAIYGLEKTADKILPTTWASDTTDGYNRGAPNSLSSGSGVSSVGHEYETLQYGICDKDNV